MYCQWVLDKIHNLTCDTKLVPVFAHIHRYIDAYSKLQFQEILNTNAIFQVNAEAFANFREHRFVKKLILSGANVAFGSNAYNLENRKPNFDLLKKKSKSDWILHSDEIF